MVSAAASCERCAACVRDGSGSFSFLGQRGYRLARIRCACTCHPAPLALAPPPPRPSPAAPSERSAEARAVNADRAPGQRARVLDLFGKLGASGCTTDAVSIYLRLPHQSASPRVHELVKSGELVDSGRRDFTRSGSRAIVWVLACYRPAPAGRCRYCTAERERCARVTPGLAGVACCPDCTHGGGQ